MVLPDGIVTIVVMVRGGTRMAKEYIEREALLKKANELSGGSFSTPLIISAIEDAPKADVVEVVRCKDCQYNYHCGCSHDFALHIMKDDDFCSYGVRKEGAEK
jgi:hypothetical protein